MRQLKLTKRDKEIIHFVWRWKVMTTACIARIYYPGSKSKVAYERLRKLKNAGYLELYVCRENKNKLWVLTQKSFKVVQELYPEMKQKGFKSESPIHDICTNQVQIGVFDGIDRKSMEAITEQELRRLDSIDLPKSIPDEGDRITPTKVTKWVHNLAEYYRSDLYQSSGCLLYTSPSPRDS